MNQGKKVGVLDLTRGEMATRGTPEDRLIESQQAADMLGLEMRQNIGLPDTRLENIPEYREKIIRVVRACQPHICFVGAPDDRHPDHGNGTQLQLDALFYSGLTKIETYDKDGNKQKRWGPSALYTGSPL